jgi:selenophosphate synthetase-related protein
MVKSSGFTDALKFASEGGWIKRDLEMLEKNQSSPVALESASYQKIQPWL